MPAGRRVCAENNRFSTETYETWKTRKERDRRKEDLLIEWFTFNGHLTKHDILQRIG